MAGIATGQVLSLALRFEESDLEGFTHIQVHRSRTGESGPWEEITGDEWTTAQLRTPAKSVSINGKVAKFQVNELTTLSITFSGSDPISASSIAAQIQSQGMGLISAVLEGANLLVETRQPGAAATLRAVESDGISLLGFSSEEPSSVAFGKDARLSVIEDQTEYTYQDPHSSDTSYYRTRFYNRTENQVSEFSDPFRPSKHPNISQDNFVLGYVSLVDIQGRPVADTMVLINSSDQAVLLEGKYLISGTKEAITTDDTGYASCLLPRGMQVTVLISGTNIARLVTIPTDPAVTVINLLDALYGSDDLFTVQRAQEEYAVRRAL